MHTAGCRFYLPLALLIGVLQLCNGNVSNNDLKNRVIQRTKNTNMDQGRAVSCSDDYPPFLLTWSPKNITVDSPVFISLNYTSPVDVHRVKGIVDVWSEGYLLYQTPVDYNCTAIPSSYMLFSCPLKKKQTVTLKNYKWLPTKDHSLEGEITFKVKLTNENGEPVICLKATVNTVFPDDYNYDYYFGRY